MRPLDLGMTEKIATKLKSPKDRLFSKSIELRLFNSFMDPNEANFCLIVSSIPFLSHTRYVHRLLY